MRREELYLADLIDNARAVRGYLEGVTRERWDAEDILRDAVLYRMLLLGEIASALPDELRDRHPDVAWRQIRAFRNLAVHSTSGSTGRLSGRSHRKSRLSWRDRSSRSCVRSIPHWPRATRTARIRVPLPYANRGSRDLPCGATAATAETPAVEIHDAKVESPLRAAAARSPGPRQGRRRHGGVLVEGEGKFLNSAQNNYLPSAIVSVLIFPLNLNHRPIP